MKIKTEYNIYIGLKESNMIKDISMQRALKSINGHFSEHGITGFNIQKIKGFWESKGEQSVLINFINTFGIQRRAIYKAIESIKKDLRQDAILIKENPIKHEFV